MSETTVEYTVDQGVARITLNRADKRNAFDEHVIAALTASLQRAEADPSARIVVIAGAGKHFSAGADLGWMQRTARLSEAENLADARQLSVLMQTLDQLGKPTLARVQGAAYGGALGLISCCDIAIASEQARFCLSETRLGLAPAVIAPYVIRAIGARQARRYFLSAEEFDAPRAEQLGLVHQVVPEAELDARIAQLCTTLRRNGPVALQAAKALVHRVGGQQPDDALREHTLTLIARLRVGAEGQEGLQAFFDKRPPAWTEPT
ncbi:MAG: enoyl-CoA hydratase/isomerase family protein [Gammaproteobacteria bacterium]|nr:enoyl-CoA hydratase/isomerase family protein [Gammaproteobacteria bacterium]